MEILDNKYLFHPFMWENGLSHFMPTLYRAKLEGEVIDYSPIVYPCICKPIRGRGALGVYIANSPEELKNLERDEIIEEYIGGRTEYTGHFRVNDGEIEYSVYFKADYDGIKQGDAQNYEIGQREDYPFDIIFKALKYSGYACANFKLPMKIFEINPRIGGSILNNREYIKKLQYDRNAVTKAE